MERKYLSGNIRERLQDLMKERKITQSELAAKIGMDGLSPVRLLRFLCGCC